MSGALNNESTFVKASQFSTNCCMIYQKPGFMEIHARILDIEK